MNTGAMEIRNLRMNKGIPIRKLAELADVNYAFLSKVERGLDLPGEELITRLAKILEYKEDSKKLIAMFGKVPSEIKKLILDNPDLMIEMPAYFKSRLKKTKKPLATEEK